MTVFFISHKSDVKTFLKWILNQCYTALINMTRYYNIFYYNWAMHVSLEQGMKKWQDTSLCPLSYVEYWKWDEIFTRGFCIKWWDYMCARRILMKITLYNTVHEIFFEYFKEQEAQTSRGELSVKAYCGVWTRSFQKSISQCYFYCAVGVDFSVLDS